MLNFKIDIGDLDTFLYNKKKDVDSMWKKIISDTIDEIYTEIRERHPIKTWKTMKDIQKIKLPTVWEIYTYNVVSTFLEEGTNDHMIRPTNAKALAWWNGWGWMLFSKWHTVRGISAQRIWEDAVTAVDKGKIDRIIDNAIQDFTK